MTGPDHRPIIQRPLEGRNHRVIPPWGAHLEPIHDRRIEDNIRRHHDGWNHNDHGYYWHEWYGRRMCHHYDSYGYHQWGFYVGDVYFWTRHWNNHFWWYDPYWHRWLYLRDGSWWWQNPAYVEVIYIYRDGSYYRYDRGVGGVILLPDPTPPVSAPPADPAPAPAPAPESKSFYSDDGTRVVQVFGEKKDAFLYDTAEQAAFDPKWLDSGVTDVRFKLDDQDQLETIMTLTEDGGFNLFDRDGNPQTIQPVGEPVDPAPLPDDGQGDGGTTPSSLGQGLRQSGAFNALKTGDLGWR
ncbi:MAG: hypothetical protein HY927_14590 [Elusimicrobia bacterium]|nr:hypothetical protein [Elusimicrobiota bacterium]